MSATSREPPAPSVLPNRAVRQFRLMTEGVGETSGETVGSPSAQGRPCPGTVRQKSEVLFVRCGVHPHFRRAACPVEISALTCSPTPSFLRSRCDRRRPGSFAAAPAFAGYDTGLSSLTFCLASCASGACAYDRGASHDGVDAMVIASPSAKVNPLFTLAGSA